MKRGHQTEKQRNKETHIATLWKHRPRGPRLWKYIYNSRNSHYQLDICTRHNILHWFLNFILYSSHNIFCLNWDFSTFHKIWLVLSWRSEKGNLNEFRGINKFDDFLTPVSRGNSLRLIFSHYSIYGWGRGEQTHRHTDTDTHQFHDIIWAWLSEYYGEANM